MELSWSTIALEVINFLVLVWILKRFLYKPVLNVIARRQSVIEKTMADAKALQEEAEKLREQYEGRLADWEQERQQARESLSQELIAERAAQLKELQTALGQERDQAHVAEMRRQADELRRLEQTALEQGARFASRLLNQASGPDTEARLIELVTDQLAQLPAERITALRSSYTRKPQAITVASAFPMPHHQRQRLGEALTALTGADMPVQFEQNSKLLAGVRISMGAWVLGANIADELRGFMELADDEKQI